MDHESYIALIEKSSKKNTSVTSWKARIKRRPRKDTDESLAVHNKEKTQPRDNPTVINEKNTIIS